MIASENQHVEGSIQTISVRGSPIQDVAQGYVRFGRGYEGNGGSIGFGPGAECALGLRGVLGHERGRCIAQTIVEPKRFVQRRLRAGTDATVEILSECHIASSKPVNRLPVVADAEERGYAALCQEGPDQIDACIGDVLEFVDQDSREGGSVGALTDVVGGAENHVGEVDFASLCQMGFIPREYGLQR